jgi:hypothetical protein
MTARHSLIALAVLAAPAARAHGGPGALDLIPEDAVAAVAVRNVNELQRKGDKLLAAAETPDEVQTARLFEFAFEHFGIGDVVDRDASAAVVLVNPDVLGVKLCNDDGNGNDSRWIDLVVCVVPFKDREKIAACFGIKPGALKPDTMVRGKAKSIGEVFYARGNHLFFGKNEKVIASAVKGARVGASLPAARRRLLEEADGFLYVRRAPIDPYWQRFLKEEGETLAGRGDEGQREAARQLVAALGAVRDVWLTLRVDEGLGVSLVCTFPKDGNAAVRKYLTELQAGPGVADLSGLPEGDVVAAQAFRGDGSRNARLARLLLHQVLWGFAPAQKWIAAADRPALLGVFTEVWKRLRGVRVAVYRNADPARHGTFAAVALLDTEDADAFLTEMRQLARLAAGDLDLSDKDRRGGDAAAVEKLVVELGDDRFAVRETATTKLTLLGEPALPFLDKAVRSEDPEARRRATAVRERIVAVAKAAREELLTDAAARRFRPSFGFASKPGDLDGRRVHLLRVRLKGKDAALADSLRGLFGPDWDTVRLAVSGKQVVALIGSDVGLLRQTLQNLEGGKPELAGAKGFGPAAGRGDPARKAELHLSLETGLALLAGDDLRGMKAPGGRRLLTSFALTVDPEYLRLDTWTPPSDMKAVRKAQEAASPRY